MAQQIRRGEDVLIDAKVEAAIIGEIGRPKRFPKEWIERFMPKGLKTGLSQAGLAAPPHVLTHP